MAVLSKLVVALVSVFLVLPIQSTRIFNQRSDLDEVLPIEESGYVVPLQGGQTCSSPTACVNSLPPPSSGKSLEFLTVARGVLVYDCTDLGHNDAPKYISQTTVLYDVAPLIPLLPNEDALHQLVPELYSYNYAVLDNTTLMCVGDIFTEVRETVVNLDRVGMFHIHVQSAINSPDDVAFDATWAKSVSFDGAWEVYRVETTGGAVPVACEERNSPFDIGYAAEYWFYGI